VKSCCAEAARLAVLVDRKTFGDELGRSREHGVALDVSRCEGEKDRQTDRPTDRPTGRHTHRRRSSRAEKPCERELGSLERMGAP
jgi:hypothetical protein